MSERPASITLPARPPTEAAASTAHPGGPWSIAERLWVVALVAAVAVPGMWQLGRRSFWNDEAATWAISGHSFGDLLHVLGTSGGDRGAGLYFGIMFVWTRVFGSSEVALRSVSLLAAAATMVPFHACARRLVAPPAAWAAGALLATSAFLLTHARDARTYALAVLLVVLAVWTFLRALDSALPRDWWIFTIVGTVAVYAHWFSALVVLALFVALFATRSGTRLRRQAVRSALSLVVLTLPIAVLVLAGDNSGVDWIAPLNVAELRSAVAQFTGTGSSALQLVVAVPLVVGLVASWNGRRDSRTPPIAATWFVLPLVLTIMVSIVKPLFVPRYLIIALPAFVLLLGLGVSCLGRGRAVPVAAMTLALVVLGYSTFWNSGTGGENWRAMVATVGQHAHPDDAIVVFPATAVSAFSYYARRDPTLRRRAGPTWPHTRWDTPFTRSIPNAAVLQGGRFAHRGVVWLVVRKPHGQTVTASVRRSPVLAALQEQLGARFADVAVTRPRRGSDMVFLVRYSQPIRR